MANGINFILVFLGGGLGSVLRFSLGLIFQKSTLSLPLATLFANVSACVVFAFALLYIETKPEYSQLTRVLILTGFCGGLSTFSTFGYESYLLLKQSQYLWVIVNVVLSLTLCIGSFALIKK